MFQSESQLHHLADHECEHGSLPDDTNLACACWEAIKRGQQQAQALVLANHVRMTNAATCRELGQLDRDAAHERAASLLGSVEGPTAAIPVGRFLLAVFGIGEAVMAKCLHEAGIFSTTRRLGDLTPRQQKALAEALRDRLPRTES